MAVVTVNTFAPYATAKDYAEALYQRWRIGTAQQEHGILVLAVADGRQATVTVGRSLLAVVSPQVVEDVGKKYLEPAFRGGRYGEGLYRATVALASVVQDIRVVEPHRSRLKGLGVVLTLFTSFGALWFLTGVIVIPGIPPPKVDLKGTGPYIFLLTIFIGTKLLLAILKPIFRFGLRGWFRTEADIFSVFQMFTHLAWIGSIAFAGYILVGGNLAEVGAIGGAVVFGVLLFILQEPLLNCVGWAVLMTRRVYKLGDRIEVDGTKGYVVGISLMNTVVREFGGWMSRDTFTGRYATIPNKHVLVSEVFNYTKDTPFIWTELLVQITYESNLQRAGDIVLGGCGEVRVPRPVDVRHHGTHSPMEDEGFMGRNRGHLLLSRVSQGVLRERGDEEDPRQDRERASRRDRVSPHGRRPVQ